MAEQEPQAPPAPPMLRAAKSSYGRLETLAVEVKSPINLSVRTRDEADDPLTKLRLGFRKFKQEVVEANPKKFGELVTAQNPKIMIIGCSDSRVDPAILFDAEPGDIFQVRSVANLVPPFQRDASQHDTSAALEYAVNFLKVEHIIVLGHQKCGGIAALAKAGLGGIEETPEGNDFIDSWISLADQAFDSTLIRCKDLPVPAMCEDCEQTSIDVSLRNLLSYPWIETKVRAGVLRLHGFYYRMQPCSIRSWELEVLRTNFNEIN